MMNMNKKLMFLVLTVSFFTIFVFSNVTFAETVCPTIIGWKIINNTCISDSGCNYDLSGNTTYYGTKEICLSALNCTPYFTCPNGTHVPWCGFENNKCVCIISPENQCAGYCTEGKEYICPNGTKVPWCGCENHQLVCIISPENQCPKQSNNTCTDSDGGKNYYVKGTTTRCTFTDIGGGCGATVDCCAESAYSPNCVIESGYVAERFCREDNNIDTEIYKCSNGCIDGACRPSVPITEEYKTVKLGETFTVSGTSTHPYAWNLKNYDKNYLELQLIATMPCKAEQGSSCPFTFEFKAINSGKTTIELDKINSNDNSVSEIKYIYVTINPLSTKIAYLNQPFDLKEKESAEIIDYRNMIVTLDKLEQLPATCQVTTQTTATSVTGGVTTPTTGGGGGGGAACAYGSWMATVSFKMPGGLVTNSMRMYVGESKDTSFGVKIRFDRVGESRTAVFTAYQETNEFNFYVKTDKYSYSPGESVRIDAILSGNPSFNFNNAAVVATVTDPNGNQQDVRMYPVGVSASACTQSITTKTYTCAITNEYHFTGTYHIPSDAPRGVYKVMSTAITSTIKKSAETNFEVEKTYSDYVDVSIRPQEQHTVIGKEVSYDITVTDKHPAEICPVYECKTPLCPVQPCARRVYTYYISVSGLPYNTKYQNVIGLPAGGAITFSLTIFPSSTGTSEGVTTATTTAGAINPASSEQRIVSVVTGGAIAASTAVTETQPIKEVMFKFTVQATQQDDPRVSDSDGAILFVRFIEIPRPPDFPETEKIDIELRNGWNLISAPGYGYFSLGTCSQDSRPVAFVYLTDQRRYVSFDDALSIMGTDKLKEYLSTHSFWIYSYESCKMIFDVERYSTYSGLQLDQGWNLLGVTKDMIGETMSNIKGNCAFEKLYSWDAESQKWIAKTENDLIDKMGYGGIVKVSSTCNLKANIIQPPTLP
jgi:predicted secreted protein